MTSSAESNENWGACPTCGEPVLIDPNSGKAEACATCGSLAAKGVGAIGITLLTAGLAAVVGLVYLCVRILL